MMANEGVMKVFCAGEQCVALHQEICSPFLSLSFFLVSVLHDFHVHEEFVLLSVFIVCVERFHGRRKKLIQLTRFNTMQTMVKSSPELDVSSDHSSASCK